MCQSGSYIETTPAANVLLVAVFVFTVWLVARGWRRQRRTQHAVRLRRNSTQASRRKHSIVGFDVDVREVDEMEQLERDAAAAEAAAHSVKSAVHRPPIKPKLKTVISFLQVGTGLSACVPRLIDVWGLIELNTSSVDETSA